MRSHSLSKPQDPNADLDLGDGDFDFDPLLLSRSSPGPGGISHGPAALTPVAPVPPDESVQATAAVSASGSGGPGSVVAETSTGGFTINLIFDVAAMAAPASFRTGIEQAAAILSESITDKITVNLNIDYSGTGGGALQARPPVSLSLIQRSGPIWSPMPRPATRLSTPCPGGRRSRTNRRSRSGMRS